MEKALLDQLIEGSFDIHIHSSPDIVPRKMSDIELAKSARDSHMGGIMLKSHYGLTATRATLVKECVHGIEIFGGLTLNQMVGGLNPAAVETAIKLGAKEIWLPTINAENHVMQTSKDRSKIVQVFDENGKPLPNLNIILEMIAQHDVILGTGHLNVEETLKVVPLAKESGIEKIIITHPEWQIVNMPIDVQKKLAQYGVFFEHCYYNVTSPQAFTIEDLAYQIKSTGISTNVLSTDFGQPSNDYPVNGLRSYLSELFDIGFSIDEIETMIKKNPKYLLGINQIKKK